MAALQPVPASNNIDHQLAELKMHCNALTEKLNSECAKTAKLRRYITSNDQARTVTTPADDMAELKALIKDQTHLIEQLYAENMENSKSLKNLTLNNEHLTTANGKQKSRIIQLNRQVKSQGKS